jgi:spermidine synthase
MTHMNKKGPSFLQFASPWFFDPGTIRLPSPPDGLSAEEAARRMREGQLAQPYILETESERRLHFTQCAVQSVMSLDEPHALVTAYTRKMMGFMLFKPAPKSIVMVGLGGGSLAKFCYRHLPGTQITVVEIDARVIALRDEFCVPADDHRFRIVCDDGARYMSNLSERVDVIMVDAFDTTGLAPTLAATDFYAHAAQRLSPNGLLVMNFSGEPARYRPHTERVRAAFGGSRLLVPVVADDNLLLFAFNKQISLLTTAKYVSRAQRLQSRLALEFPRYLRRIRQGHVLA